jgi:hypothetical protein
MRYEVIFEGIMVSETPETPLSREDIDRFVCSAVTELEKVYAEDIDVSTHLVHGTITVSITTEAPDLLTAQMVGNGTIRTAFHAAGFGTPGWSIDWTHARIVPEADSHPDLECELVDA